MLRAFKTDLGMLLKYGQLFPLCFAVFVSMLGFGLVMPLLPLYARDFGATGLQLGMLTASFALTRTVATLPGGWVADRAGRKKPIIFGLFVYSVVMALYGFSQDVNQLILLRGIQGLASGVVWPVISTMVVDIVPPSDRGKALGLYESMWFLGMTVGPALGGLLAGVSTISVPFFVCGGLAFITTVLMIFTVRETIPNLSNGGHASHAETNASGLAASNASERGFIQGTKRLSPYPRIFVGLCTARFIIAFSNSLIQPVLSVYANEVLGISEVGVGLLFTVMSVVTLLATLPMGVLADNMGRKPMLMIGKAFDGVSAILVIFSGGFWPLMLVMMLRGWGRGSTNPPLTAMFSTVVPSSMRAKGMGVFNSFQNLGLVLGSFIAGFLYDFHSPETPFIACGIISFVGVALVLLLVSERRGNEAN